MKVALVFVVVAVSIALTSGALTCWGDKEKCAEGECCVQVGNMMIGICKKMKTEDEKCQMHQLKVPFKDHVHILQCNCDKGMKCVAKDGIVGKVLGTCQRESGEETGDQEEE